MLPFPWVHRAEHRNPGTLFVSCLCLGIWLVSQAVASPQEICSVACDDRNPCTKDGCGRGACVFTPLPDGSPCADGSRLSKDDRCTRGVCRGTVEDPTRALRLCTEARPFDFSRVGGALSCLSTNLAELGALDILSPDLLAALQEPLHQAATRLATDPAGAAQLLADAALEIPQLVGVGKGVGRALASSETLLAQTIATHAEIPVAAHLPCPCCCRLKDIKGPQKVDLSDLGSPCDQVSYTADVDCGECGSVKDINWIKHHPTQPSRLRVCHDNTGEQTGAFGEEKLAGKFECDLESFEVKAPFCQTGTHKLCATVYTECRRAPCDRGRKKCPRAPTCEPTKQGYKCIDVQVVETY